MWHVYHQFTMTNPASQNVCRIQWLISDKLCDLMKWCWESRVCMCNTHIDSHGPNCEPVLVQYVLCGLVCLNVHCMFHFTMIVLLKTCFELEVHHRTVVELPDLWFLLPILWTILTSSFFRIWCERAFYITWFCSHLNLLFMHTFDKIW